MYYFISYGVDEPGLLSSLLKFLQNKCHPVYAPGRHTPASEPSMLIHHLTLSFSLHLIVFILIHFVKSYSECVVAQHKKKYQR